MKRLFIINITLLTLIINLDFFLFSNENKSEKKYLSYYTNEKILIDGELNEKSWDNAPAINSFINTKNLNKAQQQTEAKIIWNKSYLFFSAKMWDDDIYALLKHDDQIYLDDVIELFIQPNSDREDFLEFEINAIGEVLDLHWPKQIKNGAAGSYKRFSKYESFLKTKVKIQGSINDWKSKDKFWIVEAAIPWNAFKELAPKPNRGDQWKFNFSRINYSIHLNRREKSTSSPPIGFSNLKDYNTLEFSMKPENILINSGFEVTHQKAWKVVDSSQNITLDSKHRIRDKYSSLIIAREHTTGIYQDITYDQKAKIYKLSLWLKTDLSSPAKAHIGVDYYDANGQYLGEEMTSYKYQVRTGSIVVQGKSDWKQYITYIKKIPKKTKKIRIWIESNTWKTENCHGKIWADAVTLTPLPFDLTYALGYPPLKYENQTSINYSKETVNSGYLVSRVSTIDYILRDRFPKNERDHTEFEIISYPGTNEPLSFTIFPFEKMENINITMSKMQNLNKKDSHFPKENIHLGRVQHLFKKKHFLSSDYLHSPTYIEAFQKKNLDKNKTYQFWVNFNIPKETTAGSYEGVLNISSKNMPIKNVKIKLRVLPINIIKQNKTSFGMYMYLKDKKTMKKEMMDLKAHEINMMCICGIGTLGFGIDFNHEGKAKLNIEASNRYKVFLDLYRDLEFSMPLVSYLPKVFVEEAEKLGPIGSSHFSNAFRAILISFKNEIKKRRWPQITFVPTDEGYPYPFAEEKFNYYRACSKILKEVGFSVTAHAFNLPTPRAKLFANEFKNVVDHVLLTYGFPPVCGNQKFLNYKNWDEYREWMHSNGKKIGFYNVDTTGIHPETMRFSYGVGLWVKKADTILNWHYCDQYKNFYQIPKRSGGLSSIFSYPLDGQFLGGPSIAWEAVREGIKDYKLLYTLNHLIQKSLQSQNRYLIKTAKRTRESVQAYLDKITFKELNTATALAMPTEWTIQKVSKGRQIIAGNLKLKNGFSLNNYNQFRSLLLENILLLQRELL